MPLSAALALRGRIGNTFCRIHLSQCAVRPAGLAIEGDPVQQEGRALGIRQVGRCDRVLIDNFLHRKSTDHG